MIRAIVALAILVGSGLAGMAADGSTVASLLRDGYDIKSAFSDNSGGAYIVLQKGTDAYICHSNPSPHCDKLS